MIKVLFVCHGNICRSPMAEFIFKDMIEKEKLELYFHIESRATSREEIWGGRGNPIYPDAKQELKRHSIGNTAYTNFDMKRAQQITMEDYQAYDYILCADQNNIENTKRITGDSKHKLQLLMDYTGDKGQSIADPWYCGNFDKTYRDILKGCTAFLEYLKELKLIL